MYYVEEQFDESRFPFCLPACSPGTYLLACLLLAFPLTDMVTQIQTTCDQCGGQGNTAETKTERKVLEVHIEKGMKHNAKVQFKGAADETPGLEPGDINFIIQEKDHDLFKRKGADLLVTKDLSVNQALTGFAVSTVVQQLCRQCRRRCRRRPMLCRKSPFVSPFHAMPSN